MDKYKTVPAQQTDFAEFYKGFDIYRDDAFFDRIAFRKIGETDFNATRHVDTVDEAKTIIDHEGTITT